ncbi:MAG TPA: hypothetical protein PKM87_00825 [Methanolinea sp.]|nr:hypothetical protein [Methanolinea sp.]
MVQNSCCLHEPVAMAARILAGGIWSGGTRMSVALEREAMVVSG